MTDGEKGGIGAMLVGLLIWLFKLFAGGEKRKVSTETNKLQAETDGATLDVKIKAAEYFERKYAEALVKIDELQKFVDTLKVQVEQARKDAEDNKIALTLEKIRGNKKTT